MADKDQGQCKLTVEPKKKIRTISKHKIIPEIQARDTK